jgi:predicted transcriptional regulator
MNSPAGRPRGELSDAARVELLELGQLAQVLEADARRAWNELARAVVAAQNAGASVGMIAEAAGLAPATVRNLIRGVIPAMQDREGDLPG